MSRPEQFDHLEAMFGLAKVDVKITAINVFGVGSRAGVRIDLSNGEAMVFDSARDLAKPGILRVELAMCAQATGKLTGDQALQALALVQAVAEHHEVRSDDDIAGYWGAGYMQAATTLDVTLSDQAERWAAFAKINAHDPWSRRIDHDGSLAAAGIVLRDVDGTRYVRCGWFLSHARHEDGTIGPASLALRMARVGWTRRGQRGNVKATRPGSGESVVLAFWTVPDGWEAP